jgi:leader peptidase (prepilin peptidase)/N-methyltransferase
MATPEVLGLPVGLAIGSLAGTAAVRWPAGLTLGRPARSRCDGCGAPVRGLALLPLVGWLRTRGRCAVSGCRIAGVQSLVELGVGAAFVLALTAAAWPVALLHAAVGAMLVLATALDVRLRWIPDRLTLPAGAVLVPCATMLAVSGIAPVAPSRPLVLGLGIPAVLAVLREVTRHTGRGAWLGGGDVKLLVPLLAVVALESHGPRLLWATSAAAGVAAALLGRRGWWGRPTREVPVAPLLLVGWLVVRLAGRSGAT